MSTPSRSKIFFSLRLILAVFLLIILAHLIDLHQMTAILSSAQPQLIVAGFLVIMLNFLLKTYRWASILWIQEPDISFGQVIRFNFISMFLANFLPGSIASDLVRFYQVSKYTSQVKGAISSIIVDRIVGIFSTVAITVIALIALQGTSLVQVNSLLAYGILGFLLLSIGVPLVMQHSNLTSRVRRFLMRCAGIKLQRKAIDMYESFMLYQNKPWLLLEALFISFLNLIVAAFEFYTVALGFYSETPVGYYLIFVPLAIFLSMLPISWGGIGILEASMVFFFSKVGMSVEMCLSIVIVRRALFLLSTIPGGMLYIIEGFPTRKLSI
jgi:glycosyltransferase 2 family protein